jgi:hypothetical protein
MVSNLSTFEVLTNILLINLDKGRIICYHELLFSWSLVTRYMIVAIFLFINE